MNEETEHAVRGFLESFAAGDLEGLRASLAADFVGRITDPDGSARTVDRDGYLASVAAMEVVTANLRLDMPTLIEVEDDKILVMVEVHAHRGDATLHNFSGQLFRVADGRITESWMVEALPEESDRLWSA